LPTCNPQLHLREEAYHWRNSSCPSANQSYMSGRKHTTGGTVLAHLQTTATCPERTYHWRNSSCPSANQNYMSGRKHTTGGTVLAHLQTTATCPRGSIPLAKQFLPICKPQLHLREEAYHWRNGPCPSANQSYMSGRKHTTGGTVLAHLQTTATCPGGSIPLAERSLPTCNLIYRSRTKILPYYLQLYKAGRLYHGPTSGAFLRLAGRRTLSPEERIYLAATACAPIAIWGKNQPGAQSHSARASVPLCA
jgi:hypothetical protein